MKIFGLTFGQVPIPTPLEEATAEYTRTQFSLLTAHSDLEKAVGNVDLYTNRRDRLRTTMRELASDDAMPAEIRAEDHPRHAGVGNVISEGQ